MTLDVDLMLSSTPSLLRASLVTIELTVLSALCGLAFGGFLALARFSKFVFVRGCATMYSLAFRGTPLLVQLFVVYYGLAQWAVVRDGPLWVIMKDPLWCAVIALGLNSAAYTSEIIRAALKSVPHGQWEAAKALGLQSHATLKLVIAPQALRFALPAYGNELVMLLKATALASTVSLFDLTGRAKTLVAETYAPYEIFIIVGLIYLSLGLVLQSLVRWWEAKIQLPYRGA